MSNSNNGTENVADRALEFLEQAYAYYQQPLRPVAKAQADADSETYYEYVKAA
ncbi:hypothetical protein [Shimia litoralis]|uniref:hypothetical protein n=1 Tax=Shimia litoralis TaxID=420403 RepID=UPI0014855CE3|nr:hypothetical protein [Shimia litoralis]